MKGKWEEDATHFTPINSVNQVSGWFGGLPNSIRAELEYIENNY